MTELEALKERIQILEQRSRRLRNVGIGLALSVIASFAFAQQRQGPAPGTRRIPDVIEAKKFVLKDDNGVERAVLRFDAIGTVFSLYGADRNAQSFPRASLTTSMDKGRSKGYLTVDDVAADDIRSFHGTVTAPEFVVKDGNDKARASLDPGGLILNSPGEKPVAMLGNNSTTPAGGFLFTVGTNGSVEIGDGHVTVSNGESRAILSAHYVELLDSDGKKQRAVLGTTELENRTTGVVTTMPVSSLVLFDKEGKVLFRAPQ